MMPVLTSAQIFETNDLPREYVDCTPEWPGGVWVRGMTAEERDQYESSLISIRQVGSKVQAVPTFKSAKARTVAACACNESGERIFTDADVTKLAKKSARVIDLISDRILKLSGVTKKAQEELGKDSGSVQDEDSASS